MDIENKKSLVVVDDKDKVCGIFTLEISGQRCLMALDINDEISLVINKNFKYLLMDIWKNARKCLLKKFILDLPILDKNFKLIKTINRNDILDVEELNSEKYNLKDIPVVVMAGGKGKRLDPFTRVLPKPLIPYGNKPIILEIMNSFKNFKVNNFYISINYKGKMIKAYLMNINFLTI